MIGHVELAAALSDAECDAAIALADARPARAGGVQGSDGHAPDPQIRDVTTTFLDRADDDCAWLFDRLDRMFAAGAKVMATGVRPIAEPVQVVRYGIGNHFNTWHSDAGADLGNARWLSASVELSRPADHEGGVLQIAPGRMGTDRVAARGDAAIFRSQALHRVTPVVAGVRYALVAWTGAKL